jgi:hypothetical protein
MEIVFSSATETLFLTRRISTMLPFHHMFLILILGSSVIVMPARSNDYFQENKFLLENEDERLQNSLWGRVRLSTKDTVDGWGGDAQYLDDVIQFQTGTSFGVENVTLSRVVRELLPNTQRTGRAREIIRDNEYRVVRKDRSKHKPAVTITLLGPVPIQKCRSQLHNTYWGRNRDILGKVGDSLMMWKYLLHALLCALQQISGPRGDLGYIMHIQWKIDPTNVEVPYVTFTPAVQFEGKNVLKAEDSYLLNNTEAAKVLAGYAWPTGFMSPIGALGSSLIAMLALPSGHYHEDNESFFLLHSKDERLPKGLWGRVRVLAAGTFATWGNDVIQFKEGTLGVEKVNLRRVKQSMPIELKKKGKNRQRINPSTYSGAETLTLRHLAIEDSELDLHDTYWGRIPKILGPVRDSLMIRKS